MVVNMRKVEFLLKYRKLLISFPIFNGNQRIAYLLRQLRLSGNPVTADQLLEQGYKYKGQSLHEDASYLNKAALLLDFEVSRKL